MPTWVRQQLEDTAGLLSDAPERAKTEFSRLGVAFTLHPLYSDATRLFLRAEGACDFAYVIPVSICRHLLPMRRMVDRDAELRWLETADGAPVLVEYGSLHGQQIDSGFDVDCCAPPADVA
jgi:hypothetical protein